MKGFELLIFLLYFVQFWLISGVIKLLLKEKYHHWSSVLFSATSIVCIAPGWLMSLWQLTDLSLMRALAAQTGSILAIFLLYQGKIIMKILSCLVFNILMVLIELITNFVMVYVLHFVKGPEVSIQQYLYSQLIFSAVLALTSMTIQLIARRRKIHLTTAELKLFLLFPVNQAIMLIIFFVIMLQVSARVTMLIVLVTVMISVLADIGLYKAVVQMAQKRTIEERARQLEQQLELQLEHYEELSLFQDNLTGLRHDVGNQLQVIRALLEQKDYAEAEKLSDQLQGEIKNLQRASYCHHKVVNALIYSKGKKCEDQGIRFTAEMSLGDDISIDKMDLCRIYSNLLDNALEACQQLLAEGRAYIDLRTWTNGDYLMIKCRNSYDGILKRDEKGQLLSTKSEQRGRGMKILETLAEKYGGVFNIKTYQNAFEAVLTLKMGDIE